MLQRKDIVYLLSTVAKQWKLRNNGHLTYIEYKIWTPEVGAMAQWLPPPKHSHSTNMLCFILFIHNLCFVPGG